MWLPAALLATLCLAVACQLPTVAAGALLHPARSVRSGSTPAGCVERSFDGADVTLRGWYCAAAAPRRGSLVILHGVADTRAGSAGLIGRFTRKGLDVVAYDSRAHGESGGDVCTYGFWEKQDLRRVIDALPSGPVVLMGSSLGAAVALQEAAEDPRVAGVVAAEVFSDLKTVARERLPWFVPTWIMHRAFRAAERRGRFDAEAVSPERAAKSITAPVLLIHGSADTDTSPDHSRRVLDALRGPKRLIRVEGARHNESLRGARIWNDIETWLAALFHGG